MPDKEVHLHPSRPPTDPVGRADLVIVWDPAVVSEERYARLVALLGDLVRACGGLGVERIDVSFRGGGASAATGATPAGGMRSAMNQIVLPPGFHLEPGRCPTCGRYLAKVDDLEGLPIWGCLLRCGREVEPGDGEGRAEP
jgi:hypothetical protein